MKVKTVHFDPRTFYPTYSQGHEIVLLTEEQDRVSAILEEVDFEETDFLLYEDHESGVILGSERLRCLRETGRMLYGASVFMGLWTNYIAQEERSVLEQLYVKKNITSVDFFGDVFRTCGGGDFVARLYRAASMQKWYWGYGWLWCHCIKGRVSAVSKKCVHGC